MKTGVRHVKLGTVIGHKHTCMLLDKH